MTKLEITLGGLKKDVESIHTMIMKQISEHLDEELYAKGRIVVSIQVRHGFSIACALYARNPTIKQRLKAKIAEQFDLETLTIDENNIHVTHSGRKEVDNDYTYAMEENQNDEKEIIRGIARDLIKDVVLSVDESMVYNDTFRGFLRHVADDNQLLTNIHIDGKVSPAHNIHVYGLAETVDRIEEAISQFYFRHVIVEEDLNVAYDFIKVYFDKTIGDANMIFKGKKKC